MNAADPEVLLGELDKGLDTLTGLQFFENSLSKDRWHADLLKNMRIAVKGRFI